MILQKWIETYLWLVQGSQSVKTSRTVSEQQTTAAVVGETTSRRNVSLHYLFSLNVTLVHYFGFVLVDSLWLLGTQQKLECKQSHHCEWD